MCYRQNIVCFGVVFAAILASQTALAASSIDEAIGIVASRLAAEQVIDGLEDSVYGHWPGEEAFTGSIVAGMVGAYQFTDEEVYRRSAELGANYILWAAQGNFFGDEAFALVRLSQIEEDPLNNPYRAAVSDFYNNVKKSPNGTIGYISSFDGVEPSTAVFYLANHVVSAYCVDAEDRHLWRQGLIDRLAQVDDSSLFPVMALGIATWALAETGPLDETLIDPLSQGTVYWNFKTLIDLPDLLLSHQVQEGLPHAGSFYWQFNHDETDPNSLHGYTEDTIFATLGLLVAYRADPNLLDTDTAVLHFEAAVSAARKALLDGISADGSVWEHLSQEGEVFYAYAGEMLQVLWEFAIHEEMNLIETPIDSRESMLVEQWLSSDWSECTWCEGSNLDRSGPFNFVDLEMRVGPRLKAKVLRSKSM